MAEISFDKVTGGVLMRITERGTVLTVALNKAELVGAGECGLCWGRGRYVDYRDGRRGATTICECTTSTAD